MIAENIPGLERGCFMVDAIAKEIALEGIN